MNPLYIIMVRFRRNITLTIILLAVVFILPGCSVPGNHSEQPLAGKGLLDLRDWDFTRMGAVELTGDWAFYWQPEDFYSPIPQIPENEKPIYLHVPGVWNHQLVSGQEIDGQGWALYHLRILISSDQSGYLGLKILGIGTSGRIYINEKELTSIGSPGNNQGDSFPVYHPQVTYFDVKEDQIELFVRVSNFHHREAGLWNPIYLGSAEQIQLMRERAVFSESLVAGVVMIMSLYLLMLYLLRKNSRASLYLCIFCLLLFIRFIFTGEGLSNLFIHNLHWDIYQWITYINMYCALPVMLLYINTLFPGEALRWLHRGIFIISILLSLATVILPGRINSLFMPYFQLLLIIGCLFSISIVIKALLNKRSGSAIFLAGFLVLVFVVTNDILHSRHIIYTLYILPWGMLIFLFSQAALLSKEAQMLYIAMTDAEDATLHKSEFLASMSHEIRTPMNAIMGMNYLLQQTNLNPKQADYLRKAQNAGKSLMVLINNVLDFSKIEAGKLDLEHIQFHINDILESLMNMFFIKARDKKINLRLDISSDVPPTLMGDPLRLSQILINLVSNGLKFTEKGEVCISVKLKQVKDNLAYLKFSVKDTGIGLSDKEQIRLFNAFTQAQRSTTRSHGGTGLGLSICKNLCELMNGTIELHSTLGHGSTFEVSLPFEMVDPMQIDLPSDSHNEEKHYTVLQDVRGALVLLVEDNLINQQIACEMLQQKGIVVDLAHNGEEALEALNKKNYQLVFMDIQLPGMDGYETTKIIRADKKFEWLPIVAMTAHAMSDAVEKCLGAGMNDHISKPINPDELFHKLIQWIQPSDHDELTSRVSLSSKENVKRNSHLYEILPQIDVYDTLRRMGGDEEQFISLISLLSKEYSHIPQWMEEKWTQMDLEGIKYIAHTVKGMSSNLGAKSIARLSGEIERAAQAEDRESLYDLVPLFIDEFNALLKSVSVLDSPFEDGE